MKDLVCVVCPKGCRIHVDDNGVITGNSCPRGLKYAMDEITCPKRTLTSTVKIINSEECRLPVATNGDIPKEKMFDIMQEINKVIVKAPVNLHDVIIKNVLNTGIDVIATKSILK